MSDDVSSILHHKRRASLARIDRLAWWLDDAFRVPVIGKRVGVDGVIGLIPFVGDFVGVGLSSLMIAEALRLGAPKRVWMRMGANVGLDFVVGLVPVAGDLFDMAYKANRRNQTVMRRWLEEVTETREKSPAKWPGTTSIVLGVGAALIVTVALCRVMF